MPGFGGFYKGEKKKAKKGGKPGANVVSSAPTYVMPELVSKKKKDW